jgi:hypothetical protein
MIFYLILFFLLKNLIAKDPVDYIDPMIGTGREGRVFPGATAPNGMVKISPDTVTGGDKCHFLLLLLFFFFFAFLEVVLVTVIITILSKVSVLLT